jgi:NAD(P)H-nitrite reductase large subunit
MRIVIIGNGPAGFYLAQKIRLENPSVSVLIFDESDVGLYSKIRLPDFIVGRIAFEKLILVPPSKYLELGIETHFRESILRINVEEKTVLSILGKHYNYDKLVIATGAKASLPKFPGIDDERLCVLRTIDNAEKIKNAVGKTNTAIVVGAGLLGLELASALQSIGLKIFVVELASRLLPRQFNEVESIILKEKLEAKGLKFFLSSNIDTILPDENDLCVKTNLGKDIRAGIVIFSIGINPDFSLATNTPIKTNGCFIVNEKLETNVTDIFAIGDCAGFDTPFPGLWAVAKKQAELLADIIGGRASKYDGIELAPIPKINGIDFKQIHLEARLIVR